MGTGNLQEKDKMADGSQPNKKTARNIKQNRVLEGKAVQSDERDRSCRLPWSLVHALVAVPMLSLIK